MSFTLSEVVNLTGAKRRSVQLWADAGFIQAVEGTDRAGTGVHRRFEIGEVRLVALLVPLAMMGMQIGWLRHFAKSFREAFRYNLREPSRSTSIRERDRRKLARAVERATAGVGNNYLLFTHREKSIGIDVVTDEKEPATVSISHCFDALHILAGPPSVIGILDLNAALKNL